MPKTPQYYYIKSYILGYISLIIKKVKPCTNSVYILSINRGGIRKIALLEFLCLL